MNPVEKDIEYIRETLTSLIGKIEGLTQVYMPRNELDLLKKQADIEHKRINTRIERGEKHTNDSLDELSTRVQKVEGQVDNITASLAFYAKVIGVLIGIVQPVIVTIILNYFL